MSAIHFTVDAKPVSTNATYRRGKGRGLYKTPEAEAFFARLQLAARKAMRGAKPLEGHVEAMVSFWFDSERPDIDGSIKPCLDSMQRIVYANDRQVRRLIVNKDVDRARPRVEIAVVEIAP